MKRVVVFAVLCLFCCSTALSYAQSSSRRTNVKNNRNTAAKSVVNKANASANADEDKGAAEEEQNDLDNEATENGVGHDEGDGASSLESTTKTDKTRSEQVKEKITIRSDGVIMIGSSPISVKTIMNLQKRLYEKDFSFRRKWEDFEEARSEYFFAISERLRQLDKTIDTRQSLRDNPFIVDVEESYLYNETLKKDKKYERIVEEKRKVFLLKRSDVLEAIAVCKAQLEMDKEEARASKSSVNDKYLAEHNKPIDDIVASDLKLEDAFLKDLQDNYKEFAKECKALQSSISNYAEQADEYAAKANHTMTEKYDSLKKAKEKELSSLFKTWIKNVYGPDAVKHAKAGREKLEKQKQAEAEKKAK